MIMDGFFTKFIYSTSFMTMNGLFFPFPVPSSPAHFSNYLLVDTLRHKEMVQLFQMIEKQLIQYYLMFYNINKIPVYTLKNQLQRGSVKYYRNCGSKNPSSFYIKISGIWENHYEVGITFKLLEI